MRKRMGAKRLFAFALAVLLCIGMLPLEPTVVVYAEESEGSVPELKDCWNATKRCYELDKDYMITCAAEPGNETGGTIVVGNDIHLNGHTLTVSGNLIQTSGGSYVNGAVLTQNTLYLEGGALIVTGDYTVEKSTNIRMREDERGGVIRVGGTLTWNSDRQCIKSGDAYIYNMFWNGKIYIGGDFKDISTSGFACYNNHEVILNGAGDQTVYMKDADISSRFFNRFSVNKTGGNVILKHAFQADRILTDLSCISDAKDPVNLFGDSKLNGNRMTILGDATISPCYSGGFDLGGGTLTVSGNLVQEGISARLQFHGGTVHVTGDYSATGRAVVEMVSANDVFDVDGDFTWESNTGCVQTIEIAARYDTSVFNAGKLYIGGNFTDTSSPTMFRTFGTHETIFDGKEKQSVSFNSAVPGNLGDYFGIVRLTKEKESGYTFFPEPCWKQLIGADGEEITADDHTHTGGTATCVAKAVCTICSKPYGELDKTNHGQTETRNRKAATCQEKGYTGDVYCLACGEMMEAGREVDKASHSFGEWKVTKAATHSADGSKERICEVCRAEKQTESVAKGSHTYDKAWASDAEKHWHACTAKDGGKDSEAAHSFKEVIDKAATQSAAGSKHEECTVCGYRKADVSIEKIPATVKDSTGNAVVSVKNPGKVVDGALVGGEVEYKKPAKSKAAVVVPEKVKIGGVEYAVTSIKKDAFKNDKKVKSVTIPKSVKTIGAGAFSGCKKLKTITIKSTKISSIGKNALKGIAKNAVIKVPKAKYTFFKKKLTAKTGFKKTMKIKKF